MDLERIKRAATELSRVREASNERMASWRKERAELSAVEFVVFDETQSVAWNKKEREHRIRSLRCKEAAEFAKIQKEERKLMDAIKDEIQSDYHLPDAVINIVMVNAEEDGHAFGWTEILHKAQSYAEFANQVMEAML